MKQLPSDYQPSQTLFSRQTLPVTPAVRFYAPGDPDQNGNFVFMHFSL